ncbi:TagD Cytidylyltransferase [uncultured Caudovirales phage]|uniref:TagD Cytidylyltransferase n=1 Tax=uncultured Caudovirales phage TaxID=2100421 RepID=A0A6J5LIH3_9CAUD|nr:TagD Cytidylyltransferase [uncultured Caudovirales phage]
MEQNIFVNGTFDVLHTGHLNLLEHAKRLGGILHVAIDSDERVKNLKGANRPINSQVDRKRMLEALRVVDKVYIFNTADELLDIIRVLKPEYMVKGTDYLGKSIIGRHYCNRIEFVELNGKSTTSISNWGLMH